ncbi:MAG: hypothetical protein CME04_20840 [Gemmatimonadaceae bacterium]|nr:hypothetical protein [Gemmatimonadaceae bacterium]
MQMPRASWRLRRRRDLGVSISYCRHNRLKLPGAMPRAWLASFVDGYIRAARSTRCRSIRITAYLRAEEV